MKPAVLLRCPYCREEFDPGDAITLCSRCHATHHLACWEETNHCSAYACEGSPCATQKPPRWMMAGPSILMLLFFCYPHAMVPVIFLILPAFICCIYTIIRLLESMFSGSSDDWHVMSPEQRSFFVMLNVVAVTVGFIVLI